MRVTLITSYWKNSQGGGFKNYVVNLVEALKKQNVDIRVIFREGEDPDSFNGGMNKIFFLFFCYCQLRKYHPEVIHSQGKWYCLLPGVVYKKIHGCVLIHTFHTAPDKKLPASVRFFFQILLNSCDCLTFVSRKLQQRIFELEGLTAPHTEVIFPGVSSVNVTIEDVAMFRDRFGIQQDAMSLVALGMTAHQPKAEGLKLLIRAVKVLHTIYPTIVLIATRSGNHLKEVEAFVHEMGLESQIVFTGDIENPYVPLKMCDIYTQITLAEGMPLALLEAMSMEKPIIATPIGGITEAIEHGVNGLLVPPDPTAIAEMIDLLLKNQQYATELGIAAKKTVNEKFTWQQAAEQFIKLYRRD